MSSKGSNVTQVRQWQAHLNLQTEVRDSKTRLVALDHKGPLRVQRPFVQNDGSCHIYLLHPPGGMVGGDTIAIDVSAGKGTHTLVTTPAAGKHYGCLPDMPQQMIQQHLRAADDAYLEWVPQESIFFDRTNASVVQNVELAPTSQYLGWEILTFGRRASGEDFSNGAMSQSLSIRVAGKLIHREYLSFDPALQRATWGLNDHSVVGTLVAVFPERNHSEAMRRVPEVRSLLNDPNWGVTGKPRTLLVRFVGDSAEQCREGFFAARDLLSRSIRPRIWKT
ncbi:MAG: urease accessory protein UreD [Pseudomonadales bacterium]|nr:urease accessory protein UreD [Pseudomonadales bacterium]MBO6701620.1 urease accessory protein UreD [Pseudomonadales bacterium]